MAKPKQSASKKGPKYSDTEREEIKIKVAEFDRRGMSQWHIGQELELSQPQVCQYLKQIREAYREATLFERQALIMEKLYQYREVRCEAWKAWEKSKQDWERHIEETQEVETQQGTVARLKRIVAREGRLPEDAYLKTIIKTLDAERQLLGLTTAEGEKPAGTIDWEKLLAPAPQECPIEAKILEVESRVVVTQSLPSTNGTSTNGDGSTH